MLDDYGFEIFEESEFPIAYLLTFRTYGTWLHGDHRFSVGRNKNSKYGEPKIQPSVPYKELMESKRSQPEIIFDLNQRVLVTEAIKEVCGVSHRLPSGPLHDAAEVCRAGVPTVMLFVQSLRGISHNKIEDTSEEHLEMSVRALDRLADKTMQWLA